MPLSNQFQELSAQVRNWGRWGDDDQLGTLNQISPEVVREAAGCIQHGRTISLAVPLEHDVIQVGFIPGRDNPVRTMHAVNEGMDPDGDPDTFHTRPHPKEKTPDTMPTTAHPKEKIEDKYKKKIL